MPWYRQGTVAITAGQTTVTGNGTNFSANSRVGDAFQGPDGRWYEVTNITSAAVLSILPAYQGATVANGSYGLAPMQGYVKESADRLRQIVNDWGSTLAGLGAVSTEDVVPVAKGGTGGTTPDAARNGLGLGAAAVAAILGTVSQSGGIPTGSIIERGSNANGEYVKFADGLLICTRSENTTKGPFVANGNVFTVAMGPVAMPATFASTPRISIEIVSGGTHMTWPAGMGAAGVSAWGGFYFVDSIARAATSYNIHYLAIGRWF